MNGQPDQPRDAPQPAWRGGDLGIHMIVCLCVGGAMGYGLDSWLGWKPWLTLAGFFLGFAAWLRTMWQVFKKA